MTYRMPAEWAPHERCWMAWPGRESEGLWSDIAATRKAYTAVAQAIRSFEPVTMLVSPGAVDAARNLLGSDIDIFDVPIDVSWARDWGPNFVLDDDDKLAGVSFRFNAWGGKYEPHDQDALMAERILEQVGVPCIPSDRNPDWSIEEIEAELKHRLGVEKVLWLPGDPLDDETDGHVDGIATFARPGVVIVGSAQDADDSCKTFFDSVRRVLEQSTDAQDRCFELLELPEAPDAVMRGDRFCLSYVNFYFANDAIIAPAYGIGMDGEVRDRLQSYFPDREIVMVPIADIAEGGGGIHCITQPPPEEGSAFVRCRDLSVLDDILCERFERTVRKDNCVHFEGLVLQIPADRHRCHYVKAQVRVLRYTDNILAIHHGPRELARYDAQGQEISKELPVAA